MRNQLPPTITKSSMHINPMINRNLGDLIPLRTWCLILRRLAKFRRPSIFFTATGWPVSSSKNLTGLIPTPTNRKWMQLPNKWPTNTGRSCWKRRQPSLMGNTWKYRSLKTVKSLMPIYWSCRRRLKNYKNRLKSSNWRKNNWISVPSIPPW